MGLTFSRPRVFSGLFWPRNGAALHFADDEIIHFADDEIKHLKTVVKWAGKVLIILVLGIAVLWNACHRNFDASVTLALAQDPTALQVVGVCVIIVAYVLQMKPSVYCIENVVCVPPEDWQVSHQDIMNIMRAQGTFTEESLDFTRKMLEKSGIGHSTYWPPSAAACKDGVTRGTFEGQAAREEAEGVIFPIVQQIFDRTGVSPWQIDFLIVNCSLYVPTPSLCAMVLNKFPFREDVRTYNLGGMGCSANGISVDLAKELLQNNPGTLALVISTEIIAENLYLGNDKSMLLQNTLFRCGGVCLLLSSRPVDARRAKYKLLKTLRVQISDDESYKAVYHKKDEEGNSGVALSKGIVGVAGRAMGHNLTRCAPHILPVRELAKTVYKNGIFQLASFLKKYGLPGAERFSDTKPFTPDFTKGIDHFCIHAGGRAVIEGVQKKLALEARYVEPSFKTLYDWGNTSSSSIWYEAEWIERFGNLRRGDKLLQITFGSGFKCNSAVWQALNVDTSKVGKPLKPEKADGTTVDEIAGDTTASDTTAPTPSRDTTASDTTASDKKDR